LRLDQFGVDVEVSEVSRILLHEMEEHSLQRRGCFTVPTRAGLADVLEIVTANDDRGDPPTTTQRLDE
jgi:hypothetical protein